MYRREKQLKMKRYCLIVEDQPIVALIEKILLVEQGCEVDIVENGEEAIQQAQKNQYDFILMDIGLPGIDGYEATKNVRDLEKNSDHQTFIVGITGHVDVKKKKLL